MPKGIPRRLPAPPSPDLRWCSNCKMFKPVRGTFRYGGGTNKRGSSWCSECIHKSPAAKRAKLKSKLKQLYGLSIEDFEALKRLQDSRCAICEKEKRLAVDHHHGTGLVRELLCQTCNFGFGMFKEDPTVLERAAAYARKWAPVVQTVGIPIKRVVYYGKKRSRNGRSS